MTVSLWLMAARPRTVSLSIVPVMVGTALAWAEAGQVLWLAALAALLGAVFIQIATNLHNDAVDFERGGDGPQRLGPKRVTAEGLLSVGRVKRGAAICFGLAVLAGLYLVAVGGWPILLLGLLSILSGWAYTGGPLPIAYTPLGEIFVLAFFGLGAVAGTYWLHVGAVSPAVLVAGIAVGAFAAAVLLVNNHRDAQSDAATGRHTLALLAGERLSAWLYGLLMIIPFALLPVMGALLPHGHPSMGFVALPLSLAMIRWFVREPRGRGFNQILGRTAQVQLVFGGMVVCGLLL